MSGRKLPQEQGRPESSSHLALADLKTVRWVQDQETLMQFYQSTAKRYANLRGMFLVGWYLLVIEVAVVWWWTLLHNLSMPQVVIKLVGHMDSGTVYALETVTRRTDWWRDAAGVRFMWFKESVVYFLDRNLTTADKYFVLLQDQIFALVAFLMKPIRFIGKTISSFTAQKPAEGALPKSKNGSLRRNSEGYEAEDNEDFVDEDYLSDASLDSRRLMKEDSGGELRQANGGIANKTKWEIFTGITSNHSQETKDPGSDSDSPGKYERATLPRQAANPSKGSQRSLARFFASFGESKKEQANQVNEVREPASPGSQPKWYEQSPPTKPRGSPAILRARAISPPASVSDSPGESPETRRRGFGRFSLKRQRSRK